MLTRLQKHLADAGVASRRASEQIILSGRVAVNGRVVSTLGAKVDPLHDRVTVDGSPIKEKRKLYVALHKPPGYICSKSDPHERRSVRDLLPKEWGGLNTVGRLDFKSEGLIFLTNDGQFALHLTHPRYGVRKKYLVTVEGKIEKEALSAFTKGVWHEGEQLRAERVRLLRANGSQSLVEL